MKKQSSIITQVAILFAIGILATGFITFFGQRMLSGSSVTSQTESLAARVAEETRMAVREYPAYPWLLKYWYQHHDDMDIEYDADFYSGAKTREKNGYLMERGVQMQYADAREIEALPQEDQKLCAEVAYSWLITRVNEIKRSNHIDFLFCVITEEPYDRQFFLFSAADPGAVRGKNYEEVYPLGMQVTVSESQKTAMEHAVQQASHLASAGDYVDYYAYLDQVENHEVLIGMTYNLSTLQASIDALTWQETALAVMHQCILSGICLLLISHFIFQPLKKVQQNIRLYTQTKNSKTVEKNLSRNRMRNEVDQLSDDVVSLAKEIDDYLGKIKSVTAEKERIGTELTLASRIQSAMLPSVFPPFPGRKEFDIYASMNPAKEVGGDFYDFFLIDEDHLCLMIADVSGKGVPAALFMMASQIILKNHANMGKSPAQILQDANAAICANNREEMFVTVWLGILEISTGKLTAANAGHEYPALRHQNGTYELVQEKHGFVVGGLENIRYQNFERRLEPGSKLFLYTDGVTEATNAQGGLFGTERLIHALNQDPAAGPEQALYNVKKAVNAFVDQAEQFDDLTMMCLEYKGTP